MKSSRITLALALLAAVTGLMAPAQSSQDNPRSQQEANLSGLHDFDFLLGQWQAHHHRLKERLANSHEWMEFEGTLTTRLLMNGWANVGDNVFKMPGGNVRGVSLRSYDRKTGQWAVWWLDGRDPSGSLDPPNKGGFVNGIGTFYTDEMFQGKQIRVRVTLVAHHIYLLLHTDICLPKW